MMEAIEIRPFAPADARAVSALIGRVFDEHVAPTFAPEGIAGFRDYIRPEAIAGRAATHHTFVAWQGRLPVGVIEIRGGDHVSLLFVRTSAMGLGIATALMARAEEACRAAGQTRLHVHSSLNARSFYERLGFVAVDGPQTTQGFAYLPMEKPL
jgi:GNAT superfamily N-acetyltransferase